MSRPANVVDIAPHPRRAATVWRVLVAIQLTVIALILASLVAIFLVGAFGALFTQSSL